MFGFGEVEMTQDEVVLAYSSEGAKQKSVLIPVSTISWPEFDPGFVGPL
jgi:hypothetical protein